MQTAVFNKLRTLIYNSSGICLNQDKTALVTARVSKRMRKLRLADYGKYLQCVLEDSTGQEIQHLLDAISTNVTSFYREPEHFNFLRGILKIWAAEKAKKIRMWSAACSTGEEPYTMAIEAKESTGNHPMEYKILATDINSDVLVTAQSGEYPEDRIAPIPKHIRTKYFTTIKEGGSKSYLIREEIRNMVVFRQFNLSVFPFPLRNRLDIIFCRNVMIYFDTELRAKLVAEFSRLLKPGGYLMLGHAESISRACGGFRCLRPSIYQKE
ncbi:MAG: chemotaxis protein CheR [candidate division Zixibacteria bacterium CG_4_9_14_3_um_filter_46_8]|nr:MAG: chemotaxis protein CheR [candidate division Zixibacteria bacterium CG_4_9_14_3_um_filter_46_8]